MGAGVGLGYTMVDQMRQGQMAPPAGQAPQSMVLCPKCGAKNLAGAKFCSGCGAKMAVEMVKCPKCSSPVSADAKFCPECGNAMQAKKKCPKCGTEAAANAKFCPECGTTF